MVKGCVYPGNEQLKSLTSAEDLTRKGSHARTIFKDQTSLVYVCLQSLNLFPLGLPETCSKSISSMIR